MKLPVASFAILALAAFSAHAQSQTQKPGSTIWRCGNSYTNDAAEAKSKGCKPVEGGNVTIVEGTRVNSSSGIKVATAPQSSPRQASDEQKARDADSRAILESELKKAEARREELVKEYNNGEPEKLGPEHRNHAKYLERVAQLKESISRTENDIAGIRRELTRAGGTVPAKQ
jgi:type IV secretory pathway VirB4 component